MDRFIISVQEMDDSSNEIDRDLTVEDVRSAYDSTEPDLHVAQISVDAETQLLLTREAVRMLQDSLGEIVARYPPMEDDEIAAMRTIYRAVYGLDAEAEKRVLTWLTDKRKHDRELKTQEATA